jgi:tRNA threonylcarbamoyladenosine biosynthesis protein TsaE
MSGEDTSGDNASKESARIAGTRSITRSAQETFQLGMWIGEKLGGAAVFLLTGDLGAGKTVFAKGVAAGLGIDPTEVTSPTFTLVNKHDGRLRFYHIDLYRLNEGATAGLGLDEIFEEADAVAVVEWAERLGYAPAGAVEVEIKSLSESEREILIRQASHGMQSPNH